MHYLVAVDGSAASDRAVEYATGHAIAFDATLTIVHAIVPEPSVVDTDEMFDDREARREGGWEHLEQAETIATELAAQTGASIDVETQLLVGRPAHAIVNFAADTDIDAIYLGHHGTSSASEGDAAGSVASGVIDRASVPVTVVRRGALLPIE